MIRIMEGNFTNPRRYFRDFRFSREENLLGNINQFLHRLFGNRCWQYPKILGPFEQEGLYSRLFSHGAGIPTINRHSLGATGMQKFINWKLSAMFLFIAHDKHMDAMPFDCRMNSLGLD